MKGNRQPKPGRKRAAEELTSAALSRSGWRLESPAEFRALPYYFQHLFLALRGIFRSAARIAADAALVAA